MHCICGSQAPNCEWKGYHMIIDANRVCQCSFVYVIILSFLLLQMNFIAWYWCLYLLQSWRHWMEYAHLRIVCMWPLKMTWRSSTIQIYGPLSCHWSFIIPHFGYSPWLCPFVLSFQFLFPLYDGSRAVFEQSIWTLLAKLSLCYLWHSHAGNAAKTLTENLVSCSGFKFQHLLDLWLVTSDQKNQTLDDST